ncbi:MAG: hypothetical protein WDW38_005979 [Sanguina aurantia]
MFLAIQQLDGSPDSSGSLTIGPHPPHLPRNPVPHPRGAGPHPRTSGHTSDGPNASRRSRLIDPSHTHLHSFTDTSDPYAHPTSSAAENPQADLTSDHLLTSTSIDSCLLAPHGLPPTPDSNQHTAPPAHRKTLVFADALVGPTAGGRLRPGQRAHTSSLANTNVELSSRLKGGSSTPPPPPPPPPPLLSRPRSHSQAGTRRREEPIDDDADDEDEFGIAQPRQHGGSAARAPHRHPRPASPRAAGVPAPHSAGHGAARQPPGPQRAAGPGSSTGSLEQLPATGGQEVCQEEVDLENALRHASSLLDGLISPMSSAMRSLNACAAEQGGMRIAAGRPSSGGNAATLRARRSAANPAAPSPVPSDAAGQVAAAAAASRGSMRNDAGEGYGGESEGEGDGSLHVPLHTRNHPRQQRQQLQQQHGNATHGDGGAGGGSGSDGDAVAGPKPSLPRNQRRLSWVDTRGHPPTVGNSPFSNPDCVPGEAHVGGGDPALEVRVSGTSDPPGGPSWLGPDGKIRRTDTDLRHWAFAGERRLVDRELVQELSQHVFAYDMRDTRIVVALPNLEPAPSSSCPRTPAPLSPGNAPYQPTFVQDEHLRSSLPRHLGHINSWASSAADAEFLGFSGKVALAVDSWHNSLWRRQLYILLAHPYSSRKAWYTSMALLFLILFNTISLCLESVPSYMGTEDMKLLKRVDIFVLCIFALEFMGRLLSAPAIYVFLRDYSNIIDFFAIAPFFVELVVSLYVPGRMDSNNGGDQSRILRIFRLLQVVRLLTVGGTRLQNLSVVVGAVLASADMLAMLAVLLVLLLVVFGSIIWFVESVQDDTAFNSIPEGMWFIQVTLSTTGYGDIVPTTNVGKLITGITMLACMVVLSLPISVIGGNFNIMWSQYEKVLDTKQRSRQKAGWQEDMQELSELCSTMNVRLQKAQKQWDVLNVMKDVINLAKIEDLPERLDRMHGLHKNLEAWMDDGVEVVGGVKALAQDLAHVKAYLQTNGTAAVCVGAGSSHRSQQCFMPSHASPPPSPSRADLQRIQRGGGMHADEQQHDRVLEQAPVRKRISKPHTGPSQAATSAGNQRMVPAVTPCHLPTEPASSQQQQQQ